MMKEIPFVTQIYKNTFFKMNFIFFSLIGALNIPYMGKKMKID